MKVYLLFSSDNIVPEAIGVYTSYNIAKENMIGKYDYIVETIMDIEANHFLACPEYKDGKLV